jgi:hypothetical protein
MAITTLSEVKTFLQIPATDTSKDVLIEALIPQVEADFLIIRNAPFDLDTDEVTILYPDNAELVASQMIGYMMTQAMSTGGGFKSESIGSYSYSLNDTVGVYPKSITGRITKFVGSKP